MKKITIFLIYLFSLYNCYSQGVDLGDDFSPVASKFKLIGISSNDNSKVYRYIDVFSSTVFSYEVAKFEIKVHNNKIVSLHFILIPFDKNNLVPQSLINNIAEKSNRQPFKKGDRFYFNDLSSKTIVFRKNISDYGGDRIHIVTISTSYLGMYVAFPKNRTV